MGYAAKLWCLEKRIRAIEESGGGGGSGDGEGVEALKNVTGYTGGGATNLDGVTTVGVTKPRLYFFYHTTDGRQWFWLRAGTDAESSPNIIRPDDYNGATNAFVFENVS